MILYKKLSMKAQVIQRLQAKLEVERKKKDEAQTMAQDTINDTLNTKDDLRSTEAWVDDVEEREDWTWPCFGAILCQYN